MFSEHVGRSKEKKSSTKKKNDKDLKFDELDEKLGKEMKQMKVDERREAKYSPQVEPRSDKDGIHLFQKIAKKEVTRSNDINKDAVGFSLYETAHVMCSIVDITKDSNLKKTTKAAGADSRTPKKTNSRASLISNGSSGPFAQLKENAEKKRKSIDEGEE